MKRLFLLILLAISLTGCGNPDYVSTGQATPTPDKPVPAGYEWICPVIDISCGGGNDTSVSCDKLMKCYIINTWER